MHRRALVGASLYWCGYLLTSTVHARSFLTAEQAREHIWPGQVFTHDPVALSNEQRDMIRRQSGTRVRQSTIDAWRSQDGHWFVLDQVIGKHEFIDVAVGIDRDGALQGIEILTYRESYGDQVRHPKWLAQFRGRRGGERLRLDDPIRNISGATLSCRHITDAANRWLATWQVVLRARNL
jgi:Na+-translocating ferredoxin:NAD+ oxidoreductase RnfG subunit